MHTAKRIWNGRLSGLPGAITLGSQIFFERLSDNLASTMWRYNLRAFGDHSTVQRNVRIRYPGQVSIGLQTSIATGSEISTELPDSFCEIGDHCIIGRGVRLDYSGGLVIANNVVISEDSRMYTHTHGRNPTSHPAKSPLTIERSVWLGTGSVILEGVNSIGEGAIIAAGAVVTRPVPPHTLVAGVPAKVVRIIDPSNET